MRLLLFLSLIFIASHSCFAQHQADAAQRLAFDAELEELATRFELDDEQLSKVKEASKSCLDEAIKEWASFNSTVSVPAELDREVTLAIVENAKPYVDPEKLDAYLESKEQVWNSMDRQSQRILIYVLSRHLRLNEEQRKQMADLFAASWDYRANSAVRMTVFNGVDYLTDVLKGVGSETMLLLLTTGQREVFSDLEGMTANFSDAMSHSSDWESKLQSKLERALKLELDKLTASLELNETQVTKLKIAGKGSMKKLVGFHKSTDFTFDDIPTVGVIMESFFEQIALQGIWPRTVEKILSEKQLAKWREMESVKKQWRIDSLASMNVSAACDGRGATFQERTALFELFREKVSEFNDTDAIYALYFRVAEASDEEIRLVVSDRLWERMQDRLGVLRSSLEKLKSGKVERIQKRQ